MCKPGPVCISCGIGLLCTFFTFLFVCLSWIKLCSYCEKPYDPKDWKDYQISDDNEKKLHDLLNVAFVFHVLGVIMVLVMYIMFPIPMCCMNCRKSCCFLATLLVMAIFTFLFFLIAAAIGTSAYQPYLNGPSRSWKQTAQFYVAFIWVGWIFSLGMVGAATMALLMKDKEKGETHHKKPKPHKKRGRH